MRPTSAILSDIIRSPERDDLRFEYADSCEAKDAALARFIRRDVAWWQPGSGSRGLPDLETITKRLSHPFLQYCYDVTFRRGFVEEVTMDPYVFIEHGSTLLDLAPIQSVTFTPKPLPHGMAMPLLPQRVPSPVPEVMACPLLDRLRSARFANSNYQWWFADERDLDAVVRCQYLDRLLMFQLPSIELIPDWSMERRNGLWTAAFERMEFRKMIVVGFPWSPGERWRSYEDHYFLVEEPTPMTELGRELERKHGYLPALHVANTWGDDPTWRRNRDEIVPAVLRGELPKFPVGTPVTDAMYVLPPAKRRQIAHD